MPKPLNVDRELFKGLALQGFTATEIAAKMGLNVSTANTWISRLKLRDTQRKVKAELEKAGKAELAIVVAKDHAEEARRVRRKLSQTLDRDFSYLADKPAADSDAAMARRYSALEPAVRIASKVFGWDQERPGAMHLSLSSVKHYHAQSQPSDEAGAPSNAADTAEPMPDQIIDVPDKD